MPRDPGQFDTRLQRLVCSRSTSPTSGEREATFTPGAYYWCRLEITGSTVRDDFDSNQTAVTATIFVNGFPALTALDRLEDEDGGVWRIDSLYRGDQETVCDCYQFDGGDA